MKLLKIRNRFKVNLIFLPRLIFHLHPFHTHSFLFFVHEQLMNTNDMTFQVLITLKSFITVWTSKLSILKILIS